MTTSHAAISALTFAAALSTIPQPTVVRSAIRGAAIAESSVDNPVPSAIRNPQSAIRRSDVWRPLFDGTSLNAWRGYKSDSVPAGWKIENGTLSKNDHVGDLITREQFGDFELELEWRIGRAG